MNNPRLPFTLILLTSWITSIAQDPNPCCVDATCTWCWEVANCQNAPNIAPEGAVPGGSMNCGFDPYFPTGLPVCSSFTENNFIGGLCLPSCNDSEACNFSAGSPDATECIYPDECEDCDGACLNDVNANDICDCFETVGCTDADACNYNADATLDDGSCTYPEEGFNCDGSCSDDDGDGVCLLNEIYGCTDTLAINYHPFITEEDGSCIYETTPQESICIPVSDGLFSTNDLLVILSCFGLPLDEAQQCIEAITD